MSDEKTGIDSVGDNQACKNEDRLIYSETQNNRTCSSIHVTKQGGIGINCGGSVWVKPLKEWYRLAEERIARRKARQIGI